MNLFALCLATLYFFTKASILSDVQIQNQYLTSKSYTISITDESVAKSNVPFDYSNMSEKERKINMDILDIKNSDLDDGHKVAKIALVLAEEGNITYEMGANLFDWKNKLLDDDFNKPGFYYKDNMTMDCSTFVQYVVYIATVKDTKAKRNGGILLSRCTYFQTVEGTKTNWLSPGTLCFHYNGGSGITRDGEYISKGESLTEEDNHVAIYVGNNRYVDCSAGAGKVRIIDAYKKPFYDDFFTWFRTLPEDPYKTDLEIIWHE